MTQEKSGLSLFALIAVCRLAPVNPFNKFDDSHFSKYNTIEWNFRCNSKALRF